MDHSDFMFNNPEPCVSLCTFDSLYYCRYFIQLALAECSRRLIHSPSAQRGAPRILFYPNYYTSNNSRLKVYNAW